MQPIDALFSANRRKHFQAPEFRAMAEQPRREAPEPVVNARVGTAEHKTSTQTVNFSTAIALTSTR